MEPAHSCSEFCVNWPHSKMATSQSFAPRDHLNPKNSPFTAVHCIHQSIPLVHFSLETSEVTSSHHASAGLSHPFQTVSSGSWRKHCLPPLLFFFCLPWAWVLTLDPSWVLGTHFPSFSLPLIAVF